MSARHTDPARIVFDPAIPCRQLRVLRTVDAVRAAATAPLRQVQHTADRIAITYFLAAAGALAAALAVPGDPWAWAWSLVGEAVLAAVTEAAARCVALRYRGRYVNPAHLDPASQQVLSQAQAAISDILGARIYREDCLNHLVIAAVLDAREWEIARILGEACRFDAARADILGDVSAAYPQDAILREARTAAVRLAEDTEAYNLQVRAADIAYLAQAAAVPLAELDDSFLDLLASAAVGQPANGQVSRLRAEAAAAEHVFGVR